MASESTLKAAREVAEFFKSKDPGTRFEAGEIAAAIKHLSDYSAAMLGIRHAAGEGVLNAGPSETNASRKVYWLRASGERRRNPIVRPGNGHRPAPVAVEEAQAEAVPVEPQKIDIEPTRLTVLAIGKLTDPLLGKICDDLKIEASGETLFVHYFDATLTVRVRSGA